jgi:hypothetical protein
MAQLIKRLENDTDFDVCVSGPLKAGGYAVTTWDIVQRKHNLLRKFSDKQEALAYAERVNLHYQF